MAASVIIGILYEGIGFVRYLSYLAQRGENLGQSASVAMRSSSLPVAVLRRSRLVSAQPMMSAHDRSVAALYPNEFR
jgi:hypothetical protein